VTEFEQELLRAVEHGCPNCEDGEFLTLWCMEERGYYLALGKDCSYLQYDEYDSFASSRDVQLWCSQCDSELWSEERGWIPELASVVKADED